MFERCVNCKRLGDTCGGPDFYLMPADELVAWCRKRKSHLHLSNAKIAEMANMARGTVDSFFASTHPDFRYETIRYILKVLIGSTCESEPCQINSENEQTRIKAENEHVHTENARLESAMLREHDQYNKNIAFMKEELNKVREVSKSRIRIVYMLAACLFVTMCAIIVALYIDANDFNIGFICRK